MNWVIVIQSREYYTDTEKWNFHTADFSKAAIFRNHSKEEMEEKLNSLPGLKYSKCMRKAVPFEQASEEYRARMEEEKAREENYNALLLEAKKHPDQIMTVLVSKPFVGKLTAVAQEIIKVIENKWFDFKIIDN